MAKAPWVVKSDLEIDEDFGYEGEVGVVGKDNEFGLRSDGGEGLDKIVLFNGEILIEEAIKEENIKWAKEVVETVCEALNRKGL